MNALHLVIHYYRELLSCFGRAPLIAPGSAFNGTAVDPTGVLSATGREGDLIAVELAIDCRGIAAVLERAADHLKSLFDRQFALGHLPIPIDFCRYDP